MAVSQWDKFKLACIQYNNWGTPFWGDGANLRLKVRETSFRKMDFLSAETVLSARIAAEEAAHPRLVVDLHWGDLVLKTLLLSGC